MTVYSLSVLPHKFSSSKNQTRPTGQTGLSSQQDVPKQTSKQVNKQTNKQPSCCVYERQGVAGRTVTPPISLPNK